jgi:integrase/recombinase XerD
MSPRVLCRDDLERDVVRLWRNNRLSEGTIVGYLQWVRLFRTYCKRYDLDETSELTLNGAMRFADAYVGPRTNRPIDSSMRAFVRNALRAWAYALRFLRAPVPEWRPKPLPSCLAPLLAAYHQYRRSHCGVAEATLRRDIEIAAEFLSFLRSRGKKAARTSAEDIDAFVVQLSRRFATGTVADLCSSLRSFLRFLRATGRLHRDLAASVVAPRERLVDRPPRALPWVHVRRILQSIPRSQAPGRRDFAMLLMMAAYGFGAAEVLGLQLDDVDWKLKILRARRSKTGAVIELPLLPSVARALAAYLRQERPRQAECRRIFLNRGMPHNPLTSSAIRNRIHHYAYRVGITADVIGAHAFRHSHATRQIDAGANVKVVSDILGHRQPSSTSVYVRVAIRRLRSVALPVPRS